MAFTCFDAFGKRLYAEVVDQVGKQVRWLMYHLEDKGYKDYAFLKGGATAVLKDQRYRSNVTRGGEY